MSALEYSASLPTRRATTKLARRIAPLIEPGDLIVLDGPLGSGKTFWVRALCRALGLPEREPVTSPTFTLIQELETRPPIAHADFYRLRGPEDATELGLRAHRDDGRVVIVEWGLPYAEELGGDALVISFTEEPRSVSIGATGSRSKAILAQLVR